ncbi:hypothetical protein J2S43_002144 [Catenuloplanes nepalensis]|uniref:Uncharacterized protein n=1 Tax=Catenuloplanes nepalensis TaxID=587533 RepID=A0ABT9MQD9_9ACTN|nr:hypothetical protein [Catenuloplanes nepalensis]
MEPGPLFATAFAISLPAPRAAPEATPAAG